MTRQLAVLLAALLRATPPLAAQATAPLTQEQLLARLEKTLDSLTAAGQFSGAVGLARGGTTVFQRAYGMADRATGQPNTVTTQFNIGSINKVFTEIAIRQLAAAGKISLDSTLGFYWPDYPNATARKATVRQLMKHQAGLGGNIFDPPPGGNRNDIKHNNDYLKLFVSEPQAFAPGTSRRYCNACYVVLGILIERLSGEDYYSYVHRHIYEPAGMTHTGSYKVDSLPPNTAIGYTTGEEDAPPNAPLHANTTELPGRGSAAGGGYSDTGDLLLFVEALRAGKVPSGPPAGIGVAGGSGGLNAVLEGELPGRYDLAVAANLDPPAAERVTEMVRGWLGVRDEGEPGPGPGSGAAPGHQPTPPMPPDTVIIPSGPRHEPAGFTRRWPTWDGATLPITPGGCRNPNKFGMCGWDYQTRAISTQQDALGPYLHMIFPGRNNPLRDTVWPGPDYGGRAPSRWMWNTNLQRGMTKLYVRSTFRVSPNWSEWGANPDSGYIRTKKYNAGTKFFFTRAYGVTDAGDTIPSTQNDLVNFISGGDYRPDSIQGVWHEPGAPIWEAMNLTYMGQRRDSIPGGTEKTKAFIVTGVPESADPNCNRIPGCQSRFIFLTPNTCDRNEWCVVEVLLEYGKPRDQESRYRMWLNGVLARDGKFQTPFIGHDGNGNNLRYLKEVYWDYVWSDMTFGGGRMIPFDDQWVDIREFYVSVAP